jgi:hypothetical protein
MRYNEDDDEDEREFRRLTARSSRHPSAYKTKPSGKRASNGYEKVPLWWAERVANIRGASAKTMFVGIWLFHLKWKNHSNTFSVPNGQLAARGINRKTKYRALRQLEAAGLIVIERRGRKTIRVTLVIS